MKNSKSDKKLGALIGLMVGDALGTTLEFSLRDSMPLQSEITGGGPFRLKAGYFTDDTSMALALADSLQTCGEFNPNDLMDRFFNWYENGAYSPTNTCFDIGMTTREALNKYRVTGNPFAGSDSPNSAGNGSLMRLAPVAVMYADDVNMAIKVAALQSKTTHAAPECIAACEYFALLLCESINGKSKDEVLKNRVYSNSQKVKIIANGGYKTKSRDKISSSGYVIATLEAALWAVFNTNSFEEALILAVNLGDDADTIGAVTGQIAGAIYGFENIPQRWLNKLPNDWVEIFKKFIID